MRFTIRDLLWLTVVVALGVGWWMQRVALIREARDGHTWKLRARAVASEFEGQYATKVIWGEDEVLLDNGGPTKLLIPLSVFEDRPFRPILQHTPNPPRK